MMENHRFPTLPQLGLAVFASLQLSPILAGYIKTFEFEIDFAVTAQKVVNNACHNIDHCYLCRIYAADFKRKFSCFLYTRRG